MRRYNLVGLGLAQCLHGDLGECQRLVRGLAKNLALAKAYDWNKTNFT